MPSPATSRQLVCPWGGAVARHADRWPLPHRRAPWVIQSYGVWADPAEDARRIDWARNVCADLAPWAAGSVHLNFIGDEGPDRVRAAFGEHYDRLARVKAEFDPDNVFHLNHNI